MHITGVYKITNLINQQVYIGQAQDIEERWKKHREKGRNLNTSEAFNNPLYQDMKKYGLENFKFEILEECPISELNDKERYWISYFDSFNNGYNRTEGGQNAPHPNKMTSELFNNIIHDLQNTMLSTEEIGKRNGISGRMVRDINNGKSWTKDYLTYPIRKSLNILKLENKEKRIIIKKDKITNTIKYYCKQCGAEIHGYGKTGLCLNCYLFTLRQCERPSREELKKLIREKPFTQIAEQFGVSDNTIRKWCTVENLPIRKKDINNYSDEEWEKR